jgi:hypothetical protein
MRVEGEKNLILIREEDGDQRSFLIENLEEGFQTILSGDEYHDNIDAKIAGFIEGLEFGGVSFSVREFSTEYFGENFRIEKILLEKPVDDNPNLDTFFIIQLIKLKEEY